MSQAEIVFNLPPTFQTIWLNLFCTYIPQSEQKTREERADFMWAVTEDVKIPVRNDAEMDDSRREQLLIILRDTAPPSHNSTHWQRHTDVNHTHTHAHTHAHTCTHAHTPHTHTHTHTHTHAHCRMCSAAHSRAEHLVVSGPIRKHISQSL